MELSLIEVKKKNAECFKIQVMLESNGIKECENMRIPLRHKSFLNVYDDV